MSIEDSTTGNIIDTFFNTLTREEVQMLMEFTITYNPLHIASDSVPTPEEFPINYNAVIVDPYVNSPAHYSSPRTFGCSREITRRFPADRHMPY